MVAKLKGKEARIVKTVRVEPKTLKRIEKRFKSFSAFVNSVIREELSFRCSGCDQIEFDEGVFHRWSKSEVAGEVKICKGCKKDMKSKKFEFVLYYSRFLRGEMQ